MPAPEPEAKDKPQVIDLQTLPENSKVHIHVGNSEPVMEATRVKPDYSKRTIASMLAGGVSAIAGYVASKIYVNQKMFDFETEVLGQTKGNILGRAGLGASLTEVGGMGSGGLAAGLGSGEIHMANASRLAQSGKYGEFPKFIYKTLGGPEGKTMVALAGAAAAGTVAAAIAYNAVGPDKKPAEDRGKDWADKVALDKDQPRTLS